ncbi:DUF6882 domain-containing protein [Lysobacter sp. HA35]
MDDRQFEEHLAAALAELDTKNEYLSSEHGLGSFHRWWFEQQTHKVQFFDESDRLTVETDAIVVGSFAPESSSWRWGWANETALPETRSRAKGLKDLAQVTGYEIFGREHAFHVDDEGMAWEFLALAVKHLGALGGYRIPSPNRPLYTYLALVEVNRVAA